MKINWKRTIKVSVGLFFLALLFTVAYFVGMEEARRGPDYYCVFTVDGQKSWHLATKEYYGSMVFAGPTYFRFMDGSEITFSDDISIRVYDSENCPQRDEHGKEKLNAKDDTL